MRRLCLVVLLAACERDKPEVPIDAWVPLDAPPNDGAGNGGGFLDELRFAVVGDTRPANLDDTAGYPTDIVRQIWTDVEAESPHPQFAVTTGDYMFASTNKPTQQPQLSLYMQARSAFTGLQYPAMGNHECTGATDTN